MRGLLALAFLATVAGCDRAPPHRMEAGARLEASAAQAGLIADPARGTPTGSWSLDTDRACIVPGADARESRIGVLVDYGDGQGCTASGTARSDGDALDVRLGSCRVRASYDGERIVFPAALPDACRALCTGRASLETFTVERVSESRSEAATLRTPAGRALCPD